MKRRGRGGAFIVAILVVFLAVDSAAEQGDPLGGKALYHYGCAVCHGDEGRGDGPASKVFNPRPRDLTNMQFMEGLSDDYLFRIIKVGGGPFGKPNMPAWSHLMEDEKISDLIAYLRTLPKP